MILVFVKQGDLYLVIDFLKLTYYKICNRLFTLLNIIPWFICSLITHLISIILSHNLSIVTYLKWVLGCEIWYCYITIYIFFIFAFIVANIAYKISSRNTAHYIGKIRTWSYCIYLLLSLCRFFSSTY